MLFKEYKDYISQFSVTEGLKFRSIGFWFYKHMPLPQELFSIGTCADKVIIVPQKLEYSESTLSVTTVRETAFKGNTTVTDIVLPKSIHSIEKGSFAGCSSLERIVIPEGITSIYPGTFDGCDSLTDIYYGGPMEQWKKIDLHTQKHEIKFGKLIPGTPVQEILDERIVHVPGNDPLLTCNIHFNCVLEDTDVEAVLVSGGAS